jgi:ketosteroid isomerase-like protein
MSQHAELIRGFYSAFQRRDHAAMATCYAPDATFSDPVFRDLRGAQVGAMWRLLCERASDLRVVASGIQADADRGTARWDAWYSFSATGRPVHNAIQAAFQFRGGLIVQHIDRFDLYAWARQALGLKGVLLGWTPFVQRAIRAQAMRGLDSFMRKQGIGHTAGGLR